MFKSIIYVNVSIYTKNYVTSKARHKPLCSLYEQKRNYGMRSKVVIIIPIW